MCRKPTINTPKGKSARSQTRADTGPRLLPLAWSTNHLQASPAVSPGLAGSTLWESREPVAGLEGLFDSRAWARGSGNKAAVGLTWMEEERLLSGGVSP